MPVRRLPLCAQNSRLVVMREQGKCVGACVFVLTNAGVHQQANVRLPESTTPDITSMPLDCHRLHHLQVLLFAVLLGCRRRRLGSRLLCSVASTALKAGAASMVVLANEESLGFWQRDILALSLPPARVQCLSPWGIGITPFYCTLDDEWVRQRWASC